jgi:predicted DNA-binding protein
MATQMIIRIEPELRDKVGSLARAEGKTTSQVVRNLLEEYVRSRDIGAYVDDLWDRIGRKLSSRGLGVKEVRKAVRAARAGK